METSLLLDSHPRSQPSRIHRNLVLAVVGVVLVVSGVAVSVFFAGSTGENGSGKRMAPECSGYGHHYGDNISYCECYPCKTGPDCSQDTATCTVEATYGNPQVSQQFWSENLDYSVYIPTNYRSTYRIGTPPIAALQNSIRALHQLVGNAEVGNKTIICGYGGVHLLLAAFKAVHQVKKNTYVFAQTPHYMYYDLLAGNPEYGKWNTSYDQDPAKLVEVITYPNNPDAEKRKPFYANAAYKIYDMAYYWPGFAAINEKLDEDLMIFSTSKTTGHAGNRFGWALVRDPEVARQMMGFVSQVTYGMSVDIQYKFLNIINQIIDTKGEIFRWTRAKLNSRYARLNTILDAQKQPPRFTLLSPQDSFYLWMRCNWPQDINCLTVFQNAAISLTAGPTYGVGSNYVRANFMIYDHLAERFFESFRSLAHANYNTTSFTADNTAEEAPDAAHKRIFGY